MLARSKQARFRRKGRLKTDWFVNNNENHFKSDVTNMTAIAEEITLYKMPLKETA
jgi:hypothetical protein